MTTKCSYCAEQANYYLQNVKEKEIRKYLMIDCFDKSQNYTFCGLHIISKSKIFNFCDLHVQQKLKTLKYCAHLESQVEFYGLPSKTKPMLPVREYVKPINYRCCYCHEQFGRQFHRDDYEKICLDRRMDLHYLLCPKSK
jgi:hypothetical protein